MTKITILHVSDLHWSTGDADNLGIVRDAMFADVARVREEQGIAPDMVIFSGDLVKGGDDGQEFRSAFDEFLIPLASTAKVARSAIFVCPGNHDIERESVRSLKLLEESIKHKLRETDVINSFINSACGGELEETLALGRMGNFYVAHDLYFAHATVSNPFLRAFKTSVRGRVIGVACLNSAWRATGEPDD